MQIRSDYAYNPYIKTENNRDESKNPTEKNEKELSQSNTSDPYDLDVEVRESRLLSNEDKGETGTIVPTATQCSIRCPSIGCRPSEYCTKKNC